LLTSSWVVALSTVVRELTIWAILALIVGVHILIAGTCWSNNNNWSNVLALITLKFVVSSDIVILAIILWLIALSTIVRELTKRAFLALVVCVHIFIALAAWSCNNSWR
jgi:hypothetical protein